MISLPDLRHWAQSARPVFICGLERSGTSILQVSLARHPDLFHVKDVYETFVFIKPKSALEDPAPQMTQAYLQGAGNAARYRQFVAGLAAGKGELSETDQIRAFFYFCAHEVYGGRRPLEKTPGHVRRLNRMLEIFPQARVIVCTRNPVDVVASYRKRLEKEKSLGKGPDSWGWLDKTADQLIAHFEAVTQHMRDARARWPGQIFMAPYDWITDDPEKALKAICQFADLPFTAEVMTPKQVPGRQVDLLLSEPITKRDVDTDAYVDAPTAALIRQRTQPFKALWDTAGTASAA